jgi:alpha-methylacyl-CoA racemase
VRALTGIEIVSLAVNVPGPAMLARLSGYGASVTKVEPPEGDPLFHHDPRWYARLSASQTILRLDLKSRDGRTALEERLSTADLLVTASRPGALSRLGLDFDALHARFPGLCQLQMVGFPPPDADLPGHDLSFQAAAGLILDPPRMPFTLLADLMGAERAATEAVALLLHKQRTGEAMLRRVSLAEAASALAVPWERGLCAPGGLLGGGRPGYGIYPTKDGWVALAALEPRFLDRLRAALKLPAITTARLRKVFKAKSGAQWEAWGRKHGVPVTKLRRSGR